MSIARKCRDDNENLYTPIGTINRDYEIIGEKIIYLMVKLRTIKYEAVCVTVERAMYVQTADRDIRYR